MVLRCTATIGVSGGLQKHTDVRFHSSPGKGGRECLCIRQSEDPAAAEQDVLVSGLHVERRVGVQHM